MSNHPDAQAFKKNAAEILAGLQGRTLSAKDRLAIPPQEMPVQDPQVRCRNMGEVAVGYCEEQARLEALRCLQCKTAPCVASCPVRIDIPGFIAKTAEGSFGEALAIVRGSNLFPAICGRVCPQEVQCQSTCTVGRSLKSLEKAVSIGRLERFVADFQRACGGEDAPALPRATGKRVAVVGSGPAGLAAAADLAKAGHSVTVFEGFHKPGGVMVYGIPEFRLPKEIVGGEIEMLKKLGVTIQLNFLVGRTRALKDLFRKDGFDAVFVGTGAGLPKFMDIPGENMVGVLSANEYLTRSNLMKAYDTEHADTPIFRARRIAVLGGGNVAMDAARTALRMGAEKVYVVYRRTEKEMPARAEEVAHAREEGVEFHFLENAKRVLGDEKSRVTGMECFSYTLGEPDASGRRSPVVVEGSEHVLDVDAVIVAIGNESAPLLPQTNPDLAVTKRGNIVVDEAGKTSLDRVYAGGDIVLGAATVILAMGEGRRAAASINKLLAGA
ncbi:MAG: NADPH-dependent glutamate synthase [Spirochaetia bacterium]|jgi:glutamate synthase (NADPH/NADH) small chain|nr:NADPH-dependent glutamate synthase [Spirochaetia bacterium]